MAAGRGEGVYNVVVLGAGTAGLATAAGTVGLGDLSKVVHAYPTLGEVARKVGDQYQRSRLTPMVRKQFSWR